MSDILNLAFIAAIYIGSCIFTIVLMGMCCEKFLDKTIGKILLFAVSFGLASFIVAFRFEIVGLVFYVVQTRTFRVLAVVAGSLAFLYQILSYFDRLIEESRKHREYVENSLAQIKMEVAEIKREIYREDAKYLPSTLRFDE